MVNFETLRDCKTLVSIFETKTLSAERKFEAPRCKNHPKTRIQDQSKTLLRFRDWAKTFQEVAFFEVPFYTPKSALILSPPSPHSISEHSIHVIKKQRTRFTHHNTSPRDVPSRGGGRTPNKVLHGQSNPLPFYIYHFGQKRNHFCIPSTDKFRTLHPF